MAGPFCFGQDGLGRRDWGSRGKRGRGGGRRTGSWGKGGDDTWRTPEEFLGKIDQYVVLCYNQSKEHENICNIAKINDSDYEVVSKHIPRMDMQMTFMERSSTVVFV